MPVYAPNYISGFTVNPNATNPTHQLDISDGYCKDSTNTYPLVHPDTKIVDIEVSGVGGLDTGTEAADTWYYAFVIYSKFSSQRATLLSASPTDPTLPDTYNLFRRVGSVRNGSGSNFLNFYQFGSGVIREYYYLEDVLVLRVLTDGEAQVFTDVDLSSLIPPTSSLGLIGIMNENALRDLEIRPNEMEAGYLLGACCGKNNNYCWVAVESRILEYAMGGVGGGAYIDVLGYKEEI